MVTVIGGGGRQCGGLAAQDVGHAGDCGLRHRRVKDEGTCSAAAIAACVTILTSHRIVVCAEGIAVGVSKGIGRILAPIGGDTADNPAVFHIATARGGCGGSDSDIEVGETGHRIICNSTSRGGGQRGYCHANRTGASVTIGTCHCVGAGRRHNGRGGGTRTPGVIFSTGGGEGDIAASAHHRVLRCD